jgi:hypothetical protein
MKFSEENNLKILFIQISSQETKIFRLLMAPFDVVFGDVENGLAGAITPSFHHCYIRQQFAVHQ